MSFEELLKNMPKEVDDLDIFVFIVAVLRGYGYSGIEAAIALGACCNIALKHTGETVQ